MYICSVTKLFVTAAAASAAFPSFCTAAALALARVLVAVVLVAVVLVAARVLVAALLVAVMLVAAHVLVAVMVAVVLIAAIIHDDLRVTMACPSPRTLTSLSRSISYHDPVHGDFDHHDRDENVSGDEHDCESSAAPRSHTCT